MNHQCSRCRAPIAAEYRMKFGFHGDASESTWLCDDCAEIMTRTLAGSFASVMRQNLPAGKTRGEPPHIDDLSREMRSYLAVACPKCSAAPGRFCVHIGPGAAKRTARGASHGARQKAAHELRARSAPRRWGTRPGEMLIDDADSGDAR